MSILSNLKTLLHSKDEDNVRMGVLLLASLDEPKDALPVLKPFSYVENKMYPPPPFDKGFQKEYLELLATYAPMDDELRGFCEEITSFRMPSLENAEILLPFVNLQSLYLYGVQEYAELSHLATFVHLEHLEIATVPDESNIDFIRSLPKLKHLSLINWSGLIDISALENHPSLEELRIVNCPNCVDTATLASIPTLSTIQIIASPNINRGSL